METGGDCPPTEQWVESFAEDLYRIAYRLTGRSVDAEDLVQETFLAAHRQWRQLRDGGRAFAWLYRILRSRWRETYLNQRRRPWVSLDDVAHELSEPGELPDALDREQLQAVLDEMPPEFREPLVLFYFDEFKYREIAEMLECPLGTVMSRLARAKAYLRSRLAPTELVDKT